MSLNLNTHTSSVDSTPIWEGLQSAKFKGGRFHANHPRDELDSLMTSSKSTDIQPIGKKQFSHSKKGSQNQQFKPSLKTFDTKYKKSTVFDEQNITKLIKVPFVSESDPKPKHTTIDYNSKYNYATLGRSKIKELQQGMKQTGIYRNFYNSQNKSTTNAIRFNH